MQIRFRFFFVVSPPPFTLPFALFLAAGGRQEGEERRRRKTATIERVDESGAEPGWASLEEKGKAKKTARRQKGGGGGGGRRAKTECLIYEYVWKSLERAREADYGAATPRNGASVPKPLRCPNLESK